MPIETGNENNDHIILETTTRKKKGVPILRGWKNRIKGSVGFE